jgi:hypothetical protein
VAAFLSFSWLAAPMAVEQRLWRAVYSSRRLFAARKVDWNWI